MPRMKCKMKSSLKAQEEFIGGPFYLGGPKAKPMDMEVKEAHDIKAFHGLGPCVIVLKVRIKLENAHDHSLFMYPLCMCNVYIRYVC